MRDKDKPDANSVPEEVFKQPQATIEARLSQLGYARNSTPFGISFTDRYTGKRIISTANRKLVLS